MKLNFFTPIVNQSTLLDKVDDYFYLGGKKARTIASGSQKVFLFDSSVSTQSKIIKIASYLTIFIPIFMLVLKAALRGSHTFKVIDPNQEIEEGMDVSKETALKINRLLPKILNMENSDEAVMLSSENNLVFQLKDRPDIVFKMARSGLKELADQRFCNMVMAKEVCLTHGLGLLIIPRAKQFEVEFNQKTYHLIAEEKLDFNPNASMQQEFHYTFSNQLGETARQLAIFIAETGFNDVIWRNIPILNETTTPITARRIGLIDLEHMDSAVNGFIGDPNSSIGLIRCVSEEHVDSVIAEARAHGVIIDIKDAERTKNKRLAECRYDAKLRMFHERKGVKTGKEPISVDLESLGLNLDEVDKFTVRVSYKEYQDQTVTLRKVAEDIVSEINRRIQNSSDAKSIKAKRCLVLNLSKEPFNNYGDLGFKEGLPNVETHLWLNRIIQALIDKGHIFALDLGYEIQA